MVKVNNDVYIYLNDNIYLEPNKKLHSQYKNKLEKESVPLMNGSNMMGPEQQRYMRNE